MTIERARQALAAYPAHRGRAPLGSACAFALAVAVAFGSSPAAAKSRHKPDRSEAEHASKEPFGDIPKGPVQIFVSIDQQKLHLYSDGTHVADSSVATGVPSLPTPTGVFSVIQKQIFHRSNIYSNAPMPFMQRITWSGVALHEGENIGHPASHGCIRMPRDFAAQLYKLTRLGARVIVARGELKPELIADAHLFVHKDAPAAPPASAVDGIKTAQSGNGGKTTDVAAAPKPAPDMLRGTDAAPVVAVDASADTVPVPPAKPPALVEAAAARHGPISIFVSRKEKKIYVRQNFEPLFDAPVTIDDPQQALGTHVFTAMEYLADGSALRWNVVSFPGEPPKPARDAEKDKRPERHARDKGKEEPAKSAAEPPPPQTPSQVLARIEIPQDVIERISELMVPGSSLVVSDQGLGDETGEGTDFVVITR